MINAQTTENAIQGRRLFVILFHMAISLFRLDKTSAPKSDRRSASSYKEGTHKVIIFRSRYAHNPNPSIHHYVGISLHYCGIYIKKRFLRKKERKQAFDKEKK